MKRFLDWAGIGPANRPAAVRLLVLAACVSVGAVFLYAAQSKIRDPGLFALTIYRYQAFPDAWINLIAVYLPWFELVTALALVLLPRWRAAAGWLLLLLLAAFTVLLAITMHRGIDVNCGCLSLNPEVGRVGWLSLVRNAVLILLTALAVWGHARPAGGSPREA